MQSTEADIQFPAVGFTPDGKLWGFADLKSLTECGPQTLRKNLQSDMEVVDSDGRRWIVQSIKRIGPKKPLLLWLFWSMFGAPRWRIEQDLDALPPVTLGEIGERARAYIEAFPDYYSLDDERDEVLEPLMQEVRSAKNVAQIIEALSLDGFLFH